ncbi:DNA repair protein RecO [Leptotrichia sp. OH3620_COT-345]|uniref:DNA repair protein RecO n=1 Tax=Leptotrichia sp. OH3620_COT-345 TaxID=2491048 RepID=UPI000F646072|nr:DNA repair protein RecO [Leptotrichia sp. OH3620_COT-345]RRD38941.1 DNA repair protein RecO [Leptotrichia sp. OH3620_COT-345]
MKTLKTKCLVLKKEEINEADLMATVFSREYGKMKVVSYGIRKSKRRNPVALNPLNITYITIQEKNGYYMISEAELVKIFKNIIKDIEKLEISLYILDSVNKIYDINYEDKVFFDRLIEILEFINTRRNIKKGYKYYLLLSFLRRIMLEQGIYDINELENLLGSQLMSKYKKICLINKKSSDYTDIEREFEENSEYLKKIIIFFEKYINENLQVKMEMKKFLMEELYVAR